MERLLKTFYFYTSIAACGRSANNLTGDKALQVVFYSNNYSRNFCTGHQRLFQSIFEEYFEKTRKIDFFGFMRDQNSGEKDAQSPVGHSVLEVYVDGKWIVIDPMAGFIPFDESGETPLSFIEFVQAKRKNTYIAKALFHIPNLGFDMEDSIYTERFNLNKEQYGSLRENYEYLSNIPPKGEFFNYLTRKDFDYLWSGAELLVYTIR